MFYNILNDKRRSILPLLKVFKEEFYLAGGTGLALQIGHRDSIAFDFFSSADIDTKTIFSKVVDVFKGYEIKKVQEEKNTLTVFIDEDIKISFFSYPYQLVEDLIETEDMRVAAILDIACMKMSAIVSRATNKDYIDLYYILQIISLEKILSAVEKKLPTLDSSLVLKSLVYFEDISNESIIFAEGKEVDMQLIKNFLSQEVKKIATN